VRLGGYVVLPRILDKCRATLTGKNGEYNYACPLDRHFFEFVGLDPEALKQEVASGKGDGEVLEWIQQNARNKPNDAQILAWSGYQELRVPSDTESREVLHEIHAQIAPKREDIAGWFDLLDLDDYISFGGKA